MESAQKFVVKFFKCKTEDRGSLHYELIRRVEKRDAAIRKECADRAVAWVNANLCDEHMPIMYKRLEEGDLRAAIEGGHHA